MASQEEGGFNSLFDRARKEENITPVFCWAHARRLLFELADIAANARRGNNATVVSPVALEAVKRIDALFDIQCDISGLAADVRRRIRRERSKSWKSWNAGCASSVTGCRAHLPSSSRSTI